MKKIFILIIVLLSLLSFNSADTAEVIAQSSGPDLTIESLTYEPFRYDSPIGEVKLVVKNVGDDAIRFDRGADPAAVIIYCHNPRGRNACASTRLDVEDRNDTPLRLAPGRTRQYLFYNLPEDTTQISATVNLPPGKWEASLDNNSFGPIDVNVPRRPLPDLIIASWTLSRRDNGKYYPNIVIKNIGDGAYREESLLVMVYPKEDNPEANIAYYYPITLGSNSIDSGETLNYSISDRDYYGADVGILRKIVVEVNPEDIDGGFDIRGEEKDYSNNKTGAIDVSQPTPTLTPTLTPTPTPITTPTPKGSKGSKQQQVKYPVKELGNCKSKADCKKYCDLKENAKKCLKYGEKSGLMSKAEVLTAEEVIEITNGPGGCTDQESCAKVCDDPANADVCLDYAKKNNLMTDDELEKAKKVAGIISSGTKTPGSCKTPQECKQYCTGGAHVDECISFAKNAGLISGDEAKGMEKGRDFLEKGGPGGCKSKEECEAYCDDETHLAECDAFMEKAGVADRKARDNSGKPPNTGGGAVCSTQEECEAFCNNPANAESCKNVVMKGGKKTGPEITGDTGKLRGDIEAMLPQAQECVKKALGEEVFNKIMSGETLEKSISGDAFASCSEEGKKEYEEEEMRKKPKKKDDFSTGYGPGPGYRYNSAGEVEKIPQDTQTGPGGVPEEIPPGQPGEAGGVPEVQGVSIVRTWLNIILDWFKR